MRKSFCLLFLLLCCFLLASKKTVAQAASNKTSIVPALFEPGKISTGLANRDMAISADGSELFYTIQGPRFLVSTIMHSVKKNGVWSTPEVASFSGLYLDLEPCFSPDGTKLYFTSNRPLSKDSTEAKDFDIWYLTKVNGVWQNPQNVGAPVNTQDDEFCASLTKSGNLYFTRGTEGRNDDIKVSKFVNGQYTAGVSLSDSINSGGFEFNSFVDPDEKFILFTAYRRAEGLGSGDLYISWMGTNGEWGKAINLKGINSPYQDYCPFVTPDKKYLYFTSDRPTFESPFKTTKNAKAINNILGNAGNGFDDIYVVDFKTAVGQ